MSDYIRHNGTTYDFPTDKPSVNIGSTADELHARMRAHDAVRSNGPGYKKTPQLIEEVHPGSTRVMVCLFALPPHEDIAKDPDAGVWRRILLFIMEAIVQVAMRSMCLDGRYWDRLRLNNAEQKYAMAAMPFGVYNFGWSGTNIRVPVNEHSRVINMKKRTFQEYEDVNAASESPPRQPPVPLNIEAKTRPDCQLALRTALVLVYLYPKIVNGGTQAQAGRLEGSETSTSRSSKVHIHTQ